MCVFLDRIVVGASEAEVSQFYVEVLAIDQNVLRLQISVEDTIGVAVVEGQQQLEDYGLYFVRGHDLSFHVLLEVAVDVLEDELQLVLT